MSLDLPVLHFFDKVVRKKECSRPRVGYASPLGGVYYGSALNMIMRDVCGLSVMR